MCWTYLDLKSAQICGGVCDVLINRDRWLELTPRLFSQQNWATSTTFPSSRTRSPREEMRRWALERRWDETWCGIMRTKSAGNAGFEEWLILREEAVLCYFSCCCRYLLSSPTINNALGGTMSSSLEDYGGLLQIRRGDSFNGGEGLAWKLEISCKWISNINICKFVEEVAEKWIKSFKTGPEDFFRFSWESQKELDKWSSGWSLIFHISFQRLQKVVKHL